MSKELFKKFSITLITISIVLYIIIKNILVVPSLISLLNIFLIIYFLNTEYLKHIIFKVYFSYQILTLVFALFFALFFYPAAEINYLLDYYEINEFYLTKANFLVLIYDIITIATIVIFNKINLIKNKNIQLDKYYLFEKNNFKYMIIFLILAISYSMKIYLININYWFILSDINIIEYPFANTATVLSELDLLVLLYFVYLQGKEKSFLNNISTVAVAITSLLFAFISLSKAKIFIIGIPILLLISKLKYRFVYFSIIFIMFINIGTFFDYFSFLRLNSDKSFIESTEQYLNGIEEKQREIEYDPVIRRLGYQFILAKCVKYIDKNDFTHSPNIYLNNITGLIPRLLWTNKPAMGVDMNSIGYNLGLLSENDFITSVGLRPIGEAYYFLRYFGIFFIPLLLGFLLFSISKVFNEKYWLGFSLSILLVLEISLSDWYNLLLPTLFKIFILNYLFALILNRNFQKWQSKINIKY